MDTTTPKPDPPPDEKPKSTATTGKKSKAIIVAQRIEEILRIRLDGAEFHDIVQYAAEQKWNVKERQLWNYIHRADELIVERQMKGRKKLLARHLTQRRSLYARALNSGDHRTCLAILTDEAKLRGLYPEQELKKTVPGATPDNEPSKTLTPEEAKQIALRAARQARAEYKEPDFLHEPPRRQEKDSITLGEPAPKTEDRDDDDEE
jgi:hypothetical protein